MGNFLKRQLIPPVAACLWMLFFVLPVGAEQNGLDHFVDGVDAFDVADYDQALMSFQNAADLEPDNLQFKLYIGLTYKAQGRNDEAIEIFESIVASQPAQYVTAFFEIVAIYVEQKRYAEAIDTLARAAAVDPGDPAVYLEKGMVHKKAGEYGLAIQSFNQAKALDPDLGQAVYYNIGSVYFEQDKNDEYFTHEAFDVAVEMFERAIELDPSTSIADKARQSVKNVELAKRSRKDWYLATAVTFGYDSNVPLDPLETVTARPAGQPSNEGDRFEVFYLVGGWKFINRRSLELDVGYELRITGYDDWLDNNLMGHRPHLYLRYNSKPFYYTLNYDYSLWYEGGDQNDLHDYGIYFAYSGGTSTLRMHSVTPTVIIEEPHDLASKISFNYQAKDYFDGISSDAHSYAAEIIQSYKMSDKIHPYMGYKFTREVADDETESYVYQIGMLGVSCQLGWELQADATLSLGTIDYNYNPAYAVVGKRSDDQIRLLLGLTRPFADGFNLMLYYDFTDSDSNITQSGTDPYEFRKHVTSLSLSYEF